ncbi:hypothetical protein P168DRAFT_286710 [Aspergillus campestris IBT 28561]|uniref:Uncharacterized protein n=1 Tax=Aspergillus campestris (strain IBT 28561) TaxID=1392248 RepID=A0A2I1DFE1_ASPC2|nr:uncharacterized protein P168DRAFT_286710 [Aspergillus campestris IBT 28561]PKY08595.1 hypothetical protein P168DRAFT_286710 [Aspergillus campestris IBT 28561]
MADTTERLQPTPSELNHATDKSRSYWQALADEVIAPHEQGTIPQNITLHDMLGQVPAMPDTPLDIYQISLGPDSTKKAILTAASSTMRPTDDAACGVGETLKVTRAALLMGVRAPISCNWTGASFGQEAMADDGSRGRPNYVGVVSLAWSYILSVRLLELQKHDGAEAEYTNSTASWCSSHDVCAPGSASTINIGNVDAHAARWWAAILAPGRGWKVIITQQGNEAYFAPWSLSLELDSCPSIVWADNGPLPQDPTIYPPPSSRTALEFLVGICLLHDLGSQFHAGFAAALTFPTHSHYQRAVELPLPFSNSNHQRYPPSEQTTTDQLAIYESLSFYLTLSCNHSVIMSSLCGSFWEPSIPCNLVTPWLHPILNEVSQRPEILNTPGRYAEIVALICGIRRPRLSSLWIGAAISGLIPKITALVKGGTPPLDPNGYPWTGCPQGFMDLAGSGPYLYRNPSNQNLIRRVDIWRLLYLPVLEDDGLYYESLPFSPWEPVGQSIELNCALRVRAHRLCSRHRLLYEHWTWNLLDGSKVQDRGFTSVRRQNSPRNFLVFSKSAPSDNARPIMPLAQDQEASREASIAVFEWVLANHEGRPPSEPIYDDEWIAHCTAYDDDSDLGMGIEPTDEE